MREQLSTHSEEGMLAKTKPLDVHCVTGADTSLPTGAALSTGEPRDATSSVHKASSLFKAHSVFTERPV